MKTGTDIVVTPELRCARTIRVQVAQESTAGHEDGFSRLDTLVAVPVG